MAEKIAELAQGGYANVSLSIDHPEYGRVDAHVSVINGQASVQIDSARPELRAALELATGSLRTSLGNQGISLARFDVSEPSQLPGSGQLSAAQPNNLLAGLGSLYGRGLGAGLQDPSLMGLLNAFA